MAVRDGVNPSHAVAHASRMARLRRPEWRKRQQNRNEKREQRPYRNRHGVSPPRIMERDGLMSKEFV
jgi:hypothetical protein